MLTRLRARSRSLFHSYKLSSRTPATKEPDESLDLICAFKPWNSMQVGTLFSIPLLLQMLSQCSHFEMFPF